MPIQVIASMSETEVNAFTKAFPMNNAEIGLFFFIANASSSWLFSHRLLCNCEYDNMMVIHRCQNMTSRANLCSRYDKVRKANSRPQVIFMKTPTYSGALYLYHAAANSNNLSWRETHLKMLMDENIKLGCITTS